MSASVVAVIGRARDTAVARGWPEHQVLEREGWSLERNREFLRALVAGGRAAYLASPLCAANLVDGDGALTMYGRELLALWMAGFERVGELLLPPDRFCATLAEAPIALFERMRRRAADGDTRVPEWGPTVAQMAALVPALAADARALLHAGLPYADTLRLAYRFAGALDETVRAGWPALPLVFAPKVGAELEPLLALFPDVIAFPTFASLAPEFFVATRLVPIHPLGLVAAPLFSDGAWMSPREYFLHDVDHARFMVREELLARGVALPDAYQSIDGAPPTTLVDAERNLHRTILDRAAGPVAEARLGDPAVLERRAALARALDGARAELPGERHGQAVSLLLFEILHEKGFPLDGAALRRELAGEAHVHKLRDKLERGFYGERPRPDAAVVALLPWARSWLEART